MPHFSSHDGTSIYFDDQGDGNPVVLIHGYVGDSNVDWVRSGIFDRLLDEGFRVVLADLRGHGLSDKPHDDDAYADDMMADDIRALLDELRASSCVVVGFSLGARTALRVAALDDRVRAVVALGLGDQSLRSPSGGVNMVSKAMLADDPKDIEHASIRQFRRMADAIKADRHALAAVMSAERPDLNETLEQVTVPVLVITGSDDTSAGDPDALAARLADGRAVTTAGDHAGVKDQPEAHEALVAFLTEHA